VLDITDHQENANQSHNEISPTPVHTAIIKKTRDNKCWQEYGEKGVLPHALLVGM